MDGWHQGMTYWNEQKGDSVTMVGYDPANVDATLATALGAGATMALTKMPVPGVGWLAYIHDPEGNILGLMQNDPGAK